MSQSPSDAPVSLNDLKVNSVVFIMDYIQLTFDGPSLTLITDPIVVFGEETFSRNDERFCNALVKCIGKTVIRVNVEEDKEFSVSLEDNISIRVSLKPDDYVGPEAVVYYNLPDECWVW